jgi:hypothetical protein
MSNNTYSCLYDSSDEEIESNNVIIYNNHLIIPIDDTNIVKKKM